MLDEQRSNELSASGSLGLADMIVQQLSAGQGMKEADNTASAQSLEKSGLVSPKMAATANAESPTAVTQESRIRESLLRHHFDIPNAPSSLQILSGLISR